MVVAITGGLCSGKSSVAAFLERKNYSVYSADSLYHRLLSENRVLQRKICKFFGNDMLRNGAIDRKKLARTAFQSQEYLGKLSDITWPQIWKNLKKIISRTQHRNRILFIEMPLLYEAGLSGFFGKVIVVYTSVALQRQRARIFRKLSDKQIRIILKNQIPLKKKRLWADCCIMNVSTKQHLRREVARVLRFLEKGRE